MHAMPHLQHASLCTTACMLHTQGCAYMHMQGTAYTQEYTYCVRACAYYVRAAPSCLTGTVPANDFAAADPLLQDIAAPGLGTIVLQQMCAIDD